MGELHLEGYTVNGQQTAKNNNYYTNNFDDVKKATADTKDISGEKVIFEISDKDASKRDLQARDILGKYLGESGYKTVLGTEMWKRFVEENNDDFKQNGTIERDGKIYPVYTFNKQSSDGKITMPTLQKNNLGEEFYILGDQTFDLKGKPMATQGDIDYIFGKYGQTSIAYEKYNQLKATGRFDE